MSTTRPDEESIFKVAYKIDAPDARAEYLDQICGGDRELLARVNTLLQAHDQEQEFLESPPGGIAATMDERVAEKPGTQIGRFTLREQIGEGGFGIVYVAEQSKPVRRKVALKIIKPGMDSKPSMTRQA